ncbi:MAG: trimethylamine methyltransferase family protein [Acidimicrobiales bacterium]
MAPRSALPPYEPFTSAQIDQLEGHADRILDEVGVAVVFLPAYGPPFVTDLDRGRRLGLPLRCGAHYTASKTGDAQAMQESADAMVAARRSIDFVTKVS